MIEWRHAAVIELENVSMTAMRELVRVNQPTLLPEQNRLYVSGSPQKCYERKWEDLLLECSWRYRTYMHMEESRCNTSEVCSGVFRIELRGGIKVSPWRHHVGTLTLPVEHT